MNDKYFLDTNVLVYLFDKSAPEKRARAKTLVAGAAETGDGIISSQVIQEFLSLSTRKFKTPMTLNESLIYLYKVLGPLCQVYSDLALFESGLQIKAETNYSFYDCLILAAAIKGGCKTIYSEDLQHEQKIRDVQIVNPFISSIQA